MLLLLLLLTILTILIYLVFSFEHTSFVASHPKITGKPKTFPLAFQISSEWSNCVGISEFLTLFIFYYIGTGFQLHFRNSWRFRVCISRFLLAIIKINRENRICCLPLAPRVWVQRINRTMIQQKFRSNCKNWDGTGMKDECKVCLCVHMPFVSRTMTRQQSEMERRKQVINNVFGFIWSFSYSNNNHTFDINIFKLSQIRYTCVNVLMLSGLMHFLLECLTSRQHHFETQKLCKYLVKEKVSAILFSLFLFAFILALSIFVAPPKMSYLVYVPGVCFVAIFIDCETDLHTT